MTIQTVIPTPSDRSVKELLRLGFTLSEPAAWHPHLRVATLPAGWSIVEAGKHSCHINDSSGRKRVYVAGSDVSGMTIRLLTRYQLQPCYTVDLARNAVKGAIKEGDEVVHEVSVPLTGNDPIWDYKGTVEPAQRKGNHFLEAWLLEHGLPDWKDPFAYWDTSPLDTSPAT